MLEELVKLQKEYTELKAQMIKVQSDLNTKMEEYLVKEFNIPKGQEFGLIDIIAKIKKDD